MNKLPQPPKFSPSDPGKNSAAQRKATPVAPPPYRPQPTPRVLQTKSAIAHQSVQPRGRPVAPLVYGPNPAPKVLQQKAPGAPVSRGTQLPQARPARPPCCPPSRLPQPKLQPPAHRSAPSAMTAPVLMTAPFNSPGVLQLKVTVHKSNGKYELKGRPHFQSHVRRELVKKWNAAYPGAHLSLAGLNLTDQGLDQCHKTSWSDIRDWVQGYLNGDLTKEELVLRTDALYGADAENKTDEWKRMNGQRKKLIQVVEGKKWAQLPAEVPQLCSALNSATPNLRLDDHDLNIKIQQHFDAHVVPNSKGQFSISRHQRSKFKGVGSSPKRTPKKTRVYTSSADSPLSKSQMTPKTGAALLGSGK